MINEYIKQIIAEETKKNSNKLYIVSRIKEYLQIIILQFIYTNPKYKSIFVFTGGTCLRHFFGLERLSEDLDFDTVEDIDTNVLVLELEGYFRSNLKVDNLTIALKQQGRQILLKFAMLKELDISVGNDSDLLYIKLDISKVKGKAYLTQKTSKSAFGFNFVALHYDLPSLFSGKIAAVLTRNLLSGREDRQIVKGRDFYDLLWYLKKDTPVNLPFLEEKLGEGTLTIQNIKERVLEKVLIACGKNKNDFENDLLPFISDNSFIRDYVQNYLDEFKRCEIKVAL